MLYPLLWMLASSFKPESEIFGIDLADPVARSSLDAYWRGWFGLQRHLRHLLPELAAIVASCAVIGNVMSPARSPPTPSRG